MTTRVVAALRKTPPERRVGVVHEDRLRRIEVFTKGGAIFVSTEFKGRGGQRIRFIASPAGAAILHAALGKVIRGKGKEYVVPAQSVWTLTEVVDLDPLGRLGPTLPPKRKP